MNKVIVFAFIVICALVASAPFVSCGRGYSEGERQGVIIKFSQKGFINKSWEGTLDMGGIHNKRAKSGNVMIQNHWEFSVTDPEAAKDVQAAFERGESVNLHYVEWVRTAKIKMDTDYEVTKAVVVGD